MPAASLEVEDVLSAQDSPNSSPDTGLTVGIAIATVFLVGGLLVALGVLVRKKNKGLFRFSLWGPAQLPVTAGAAGRVPPQLGGTPDGGRPKVNQLEMGTV